LEEIDREDRVTRPNLQAERQPHGSANALRSGRLPGGYHFHKLSQWRFLERWPDFRLLFIARSRKECFNGRRRKRAAPRLARERAERAKRSAKG
jgi:hypothetical protein